MLFHVLGPLEVRVPGGDRPAGVPRKPAALLATLLLNADEWVDCDRLVEAVWHGRTPPRSALSNLKSYVWQLRRSLPPTTDGGPRIETRVGAYRLRVEPGELDTDRFRQHTAHARRAVARGDVEDAVRHAEAATALWRGRPFTELSTEAVAPVVSELEELRWEVRETLADALTAQERYREATALLHELTAANPLREGSWARLVVALVRAGRRSEALASYDRARRVIAEELGVNPGRELAEAHRCALTEPATRRVRCDLPRDVPDFTGRDDEVTRLARVSRTAATTVPVAVVDGMPGVGKTALAVHVAHRIAGRFPDGQLFVDLRSPAGEPLGPGALLARLLRTVGVRDEDVPKTAEERAAAWRAELAGRRVLLVLDDAASPDQVRPLLPGSAGSMVLITTRTRLLRLDAVEPVSLTPLTRDDTATLFRAAVGSCAADVLREVIRRTEGLPAAIRAAAALFHSRPQWTVEQFAARLAEENVHTATTLVEPTYRDLGDCEHRLLHAVTTTTGALDPRRAGQAVGVAAAEARRGLERLIDHHLLTEPSPGRYEVHPLVGDYTRHVTPARRELTAV